MSDPIQKNQTCTGGQCPRTSEIKTIHQPFSSNQVIVRKKDSTEKLIQHTTKDTYSIPCFDDILHVLDDSKLFSTLDLKSGYWQVELRESDKLKTAFQIRPMGFFVCIRMPLGLCNGPATFQRLMERFIGTIILCDGFDLFT